MLKRRIRHLVLLLGLASSGFASSGCGTNALVDEYCDAKCDCERCTDEEREICGIRGQARFDVADVYGCSAEYEEYRTCIIDESECDDIDGDDYYGPTCQDVACDCDDEFEDYTECEDDASKEGILDLD